MQYMILEWILNWKNNAMNTMGSTDKTEIQKMKYYINVNFSEFDNCSVIIWEFSYSYETHWSSSGKGNDTYQLYSNGSGKIWERKHGKLNEAKY